MILNCWYYVYHCVKKHCNSDEIVLLYSFLTEASLHLFSDLPGRARKTFRLSERPETFRLFWLYAWVSKSDVGVGSLYTVVMQGARWLPEWYAQSSFPTSAILGNDSTLSFTPLYNANQIVGSWQLLWCSRVGCI